MGTSDHSILDAAYDGPELDELATRAMRAQVAAGLFGATDSSVMVGRYALVETLGAGGMGVVYAAWDGALGRRVAIKVLPAEEVGNERERARLIREAQALAKLSHPNVVHVYEVGEHEGSVFIAMELVEGCALSAWQSRPGRSEREILEVYVQAGRGLGAAHRAGLVHRDFKPSNVLVGDDGRARVLDFGLAHGPGLSVVSTSPSGGSLQTTPTGSVTRTGALAGTPAYMSPEQFSGKAATPASDQFSFCVSLYEALVGARPFELAALIGSKERPLPAPTRGRRRLTWSIQRALRRGLALDPSQRWADMDAVLLALQRGAVWRRRRWMSAGVVALGAGLWVAAGRPFDPSCALPSYGPPAEWSDDRRRELREAIYGTGQPFARSVHRTVEDRLGRYAKRWADESLRVCHDPESRADPQKNACLDRGADQFSEVVDGLARSDVKTQVETGKVLDTLEDLKECLRRSDAAPNPEPAVSDEVYRGLAKGRVMLAQGRYADVDQTLEALSRGSQLRGSAVLAELLELRGRSLAKLGRWDEAQALLARASASTPAVSARARVQLATMGLLLDRERWQSAEDWSVELDQMLALHDTPRELRADYLDLRGQLWLRATPAEPSRAVEHHHHALELRGDADARAVMTTKKLLANAYAELGHRDEAERLYEEVLESRQDEVGPRHPEYAEVLFDLGLLAFEAEDYVTARNRFQHVLKIDRETLGTDSSVAARTEVKLADALLALGDHEQALWHARAAWRVQSKLPPEHSDHYAALAILASVEQEVGEYEAALRHQLALVGHADAEQPPLLVNIAWLYCQVDSCADAVPWVAEARVALAELRESVDSSEDDAWRRAALQAQILTLYLDTVEVLIDRSQGRRASARRRLERLHAETLAVELTPEDVLMRDHVDKLLDDIPALVESLEDPHG